MLAEADAAGTAVVMHPRTWRSLTKLKEQSSGSNKPLLAEHTSPLRVPVGADPGRQSVGSIYGVPLWLTSQLATIETRSTASSAFVYDSAQVVAVMRAEATITADTSAKFSSDQTAVRATMRADVLLPYPEAVRIGGILP